MDCKVEEVRREMESRLDSQRRHMVQKASLLKNEVDELKVHSQYITFIAFPSQCAHVIMCDQVTVGNFPLNFKIIISPKIRKQIKSMSFL